MPSNHQLNRVVLSRALACASLAVVLGACVKTARRDIPGTFAAEGGIVVHAARFAVLNAVTLAASTAAMFVLVDWAGYPELAVWLPLTVAIPVAHYLGMKHWTFAARP